MAWKSVKEGFEFLANKKDVDALIKEHVDLGWRHDALKNNRNRLTWPYVTDKTAKNVVVFPSTYSDNRGLRNTRAELRRIMTAWPSPTVSDQLTTPPTSTSIKTPSINPVEASWRDRYANKDYEDARNEYIQRFIRPGLKDTAEAKRFYKERVVPLRNQPREPMGRDLTPSGPMDFDRAMSHPDFLGDGWVPGRGNPQVKEPRD